MNSSQNALSLAALREFDPQGGKGGGAETRWLCPLCGQGKSRGDAHRCLSLRKSDGVWHCHRCRESGVLSEFRKSSASSDELSRSRIQQARSRRARLSQLHGDALAPLSTPRSNPPEKTDDTLQVLWQRSQDLAGTSGIAYLQSRGIEAQVAAHSQLRYSPCWGKSRGRAVLFPIFNRDRQLVAVQGRYVDEGLSSTKPAIKARTIGPLKEGVFQAYCDLNGRLLGPFDGVSPIIVTEAPIDALSLAAVGFPAIALCGTSIPHWFHLACGLKPVVLATDADEAGDEAAIEHENFLKVYGAKCSRLRPEGAKDWNEMLQRKGVDDLCDWVSFHLL